MLRRGAPVALALTLALGLAACGSDNASSTGGTGNANCATGSIKASGSTAQANAMTDWINSYQTSCSGATIDYQAVGSGAGVQDFINNQTSFAGSDSALKPEETAPANARCATGIAINIPMVGGAIAIAYNLEGVDKLIMTPDLLAGIFGNTITKWNDPKIVAANPGVTLPDASIVQFHRSDESGTTDNFTKYLTAAAPTAWTFPGGKSWTAPGGVAAQGSDGVSKQIKSTDGAIGYVEWGFAQDDGLSVAQIDNGGGAVELTAESAGQAVAAAKVTGTGKDLALKLDYATKTPGVYPVVLVTYEIVCSAGNTGGTAPLLKSFLGYTSTDGQASLNELGAAPLPASIQTQVIASVQTIS